MHKYCVTIVCAAALAAASPALATTVAGGGSKTADCAVVFEIPGANKPALPKTPKAVDCVDGDVTCDDDGLRNGECVFALQLCINSSALETCAADSVESIVVAHADDNGEDPRFDVDFQALQFRADALGVPSSSPDQCTLSSSITVRLRGPDSENVMKKNRKVLRVDTEGTTEAGSVADVDKIKFTCRPEGDAVYLPEEVYEGTFDRIRKQIFQQSCAIPVCHDSESQTGGLILLPGSAYSNLIDVTPSNAAAAADMLKRVTPGDETTSFLYRKLTGDLEPGYESRMPLGGGALDAELIELVRLWIIGDMVLGPAPENGWVEGTDQ